jgi:hypothetical protein
MTYEMLTTAGTAEVIASAKHFFQDRVPNNAAFPEKEGPGWVTLRGQGGEEIALSATEVPGGSRVRASTLLFDQAIGRFLTTLPAMREGAA